VPCAAASVAGHSIAYWDGDFDAEAFVAVHSAFQCVGQGDQVTVQDMARRSERCRVSKVAPFVPGTEAEGYR